MNLEVKALKSKLRKHEKANLAADVESNESSSSIEIPSSSSSDERSLSAASVGWQTASSTSTGVVWGLYSMCTAHMAPPSVPLVNLAPT